MSVYHVQSTSTHEYLYRCAMLSEAHWLMGYLVDFYPVISLQRDVSDDAHMKWAPPIETHIAFENDIKAAMRRMNWMADDEENIPYMASISSIIWPKFQKYMKRKRKEGLKPKAIMENVFNPDGSPTSENDFMLPVERFAKIVVPYNLMVRGEQKFTISEVRGDSINPFLWTAKLAVYHEQTDINPSTERIDDRLSNDPKDAISGHSMLQNNVKSEKIPEKAYESIGGKGKNPNPLGKSPNALNLAGKPWR